MTKSQILCDNFMYEWHSYRVILHTLIRIVSDLASISTARYLMQLIKFKMIGDYNND
jgi:hypothetical protein